LAGAIKDALPNEAACLALLGRSSEAKLAACALPADFAAALYARLMADRM